LNADSTATSTSGSGANAPQLRLITAGPSAAACSIPEIACVSVRPRKLDGLASQLSKTASG
jgi:hypothetical protein